MRISPHFTLEELCKSQTALRLGLDNTPSNSHIVSLKALCEHVLEPVRERFGPFSPSSGYRSEELNRAIGGAALSQHRFGQAADIEVPGVDNVTLACWIRDTLEFDQLILEYHDKGDPRSGWVHVSWREFGTNRKEVLTALKGRGYSIGIVP